MPVEDTGTVLSREVKRALSEARLSAPAAAARLGWDRKRLYRWMDGSVSPRLEDIEEFSKEIGQPLFLAVGGDTEEEPPQPEWVERLLAGIMALEESDDLTDADIARAQARAAAFLAVSQRARPRREGDGDASRGGP